MSLAPKFEMQPSASRCQPIYRVGGRVARVRVVVGPRVRRPGDGLLPLGVGRQALADVRECLLGLEVGDEAGGLHPGDAAGVDLARGARLAALTGVGAGGGVVVRARPVLGAARGGGPDADLVFVDADRAGGDHRVAGAISLTAGGHARGAIGALDALLTLAPRWSLLTLAPRWSLLTRQLVDLGLEGYHLSLQLLELFRADCARRRWWSIGTAGGASEGDSARDSAPPKPPLRGPQPEPA